MKAAVTGLVKQIGSTVTPQLVKAFDAIAFSLSSEALNSAAHLNIKKEDTSPPKQYQVHWGSDFGALTTNEEVIEKVPSPLKDDGIEYQIHPGAEYFYPTTNIPVKRYPGNGTPSPQVSEAEKSPLTLAQVTCIQFPGNW